MAVTKELVYIISALGTTDNVSKWKHDCYWHSMVFITESLNFKMAKLLKLDRNYS